MQYNSISFFIPLPPSPLPSSIFGPFLYFLLSFISIIVCICVFYLREIIWYWRMPVWFTSLTLWLQGTSIFQQMIQVILPHSRVVVHCVYIPHFVIHVDEYIRCFQDTAIMTCAAVNTSMHTYTHLRYVFDTFWKVPRWRIAGPNRISNFHFILNLWFVSEVSYGNRERAGAALTPYMHSLLPAGCFSLR